MRLTQVQCRNFRCLANVDFKPEPGINVIRGRNAQGKTSILEAILYATTSKSHRTNQDAELVRHGEDSFSITVHATSPASDLRIDANYWRGAKRFKINGVALDRISGILGRVHVVFFSPEDLGLVKGSAAQRRRFLDMELSQMCPQYLTALQEYRTVLRQRNQLLRDATGTPAAIDEWDALLVRHGAAVMRERREFIQDLGRYATRFYADIAEGESLSVQYAPDVAHEDELLDKLIASRDSDLRRQQTVHGPHRDDIEFRIHDTPARSHGSQGQQKTAALSVKLAEIALVVDRAGQTPVLMLDEVLAELDDVRAAKLFAAIPDDVQTLITTTDVSGTRNTGFRPQATFGIQSGALNPIEQNQVSRHG